MKESEIVRVDELEMLTLSFYSKLNEERREILEAFAMTGRSRDVSTRNR